MTGVERPRVYVDGTPLRGSDGVPARGSWAWVPVAVLVVGLVLLARAQTPPPPEPPVVLPVALRLVVGADLATSQSGVLVVPVEVVNAGPVVELVETRLRAEPLRLDPDLNGVSTVAAGGTGRLVALLQPDCALVRGGLGFLATLEVTAAGPEGQTGTAVADLAADPGVAAKVAALCAGPGLG